MHRLTSILLTGAFMLAASLYAATPALATANAPSSLSGTEFATTLINGVDRYDTAIRVSQAGFPAGAPTVVIARGDSYPDALCSAPLAHAYGGPLLLAPPGGLTPGIVAELVRLHPAEVVLTSLGESTSKVRKQLASALPTSSVISLVGKDRYETAALVAKAMKAKVGAPDKVVIAPGDSFADALAVAPLAAAKGWPILYTPQYQSLPKVTQAALKDLAVRSILEVGTRVATGMTDVTRIVGADRYQTCMGIFEYAIAQGLSPAHLAFVRGDDYPDGVASGPYLALDDGVLLLTSGGELTPSTQSFLEARIDGVLNVDAIGLDSMPRGAWAQLRPPRGSRATPSTTTTSTAPPSSTTTIVRPTTTTLRSTTTTIVPTTATTQRSVTTTTVTPTTTTLRATTTTLRPTTTTTALATTTTQRSTTTTVRPTTTTNAPVPLNAASFDLQSAINACPVGGTVSIPAGTFTILSTIRLKSGVTLQGAGVGQTILSMPSQTSATVLLMGDGVNNVGISDMTLSSPSATGNVLAIRLSRYSQVTIGEVQVDGCQYALKADTQGSGLTVRNFTARACGQVYISNLDGGSFSGLDLDMVTQRLTTVTFHALYLESNNHNLAFTNVRARGGSGWTVQLYSDSAVLSDYITFDGLDVSGWPIVIGNGFSNIAIRSLTAVASSGSVVELYSGAHAIVVDGFTCSGGSQLVESNTSDAIFRNGTYQGPSLGTGATFQNVSLQ